MKRVDRATVLALRLRAPQASTYDATFLRGKIIGGEIFGAFSDQERSAIWERLQYTKGLIPSLDDFFTNINYLAALSNCLKWLTPISSGETVRMAIQKIFSPARIDYQSTVQGFNISVIPTTTFLADQFTFGYRSLIAFAMRNYRRIPKKPSGKDLLAKPTLEANVNVLGEFAKLASRLGFASTEIVALQQSSVLSEVAIATVLEHPRPLLVTEGSGIPITQRSGMPLNRAYDYDGQFFTLCHLHNDIEEVGEGITSFYVRKYIYQAFFGRWQSDTTISTIQERFATVLETEQTQQVGPNNILSGNEQQVSAPQNFEQVRVQRELDQTRQEIEQARQYAEQTRRDADQKAQQELNQARQEIEQARQYAEQARRDAEQKAQQELNQARQEIEQTRQDAEQAQKRAEQARLEIEQHARQEIDLAQKAASQAWQEAERQTQEAEQACREAELRTEAEGVRRESEQQALESNQAQREAERQAQLQNVETEDHELRMQQQDELFAEDSLGGEEDDLVQGNNLQPTGEAPNLDANKRATQLPELSSLLSRSIARAEPVAMTNSNTGEPFRKVGTSPENTQVQSEQLTATAISGSATTSNIGNLIIFKAKDPQSTFYRWNTICECTAAGVSRKVKDLLKDNMSLFDTELNTITPENCLENVSANGTYTVLVLSRSCLNVDDALRESAEVVHTEALSHRKMRNKRLSNVNISEEYHIRKKQMLEESEPVYAERTVNNGTEDNLPSEDEEL